MLNFNVPWTMNLSNIKVSGTRKVPIAKCSILVLRLSIYLQIYIIKAHSLEVSKKRNAVLTTMYVCMYVCLHACMNECILCVEILWHLLFSSQYFFFMHHFFFLLIPMLYCSFHNAKTIMELTLELL